MLLVVSFAFTSMLLARKGCSSEQREEKGTRKEMVKYTFDSVVPSPNTCHHMPEDGGGGDAEDE